MPRFRSINAPALAVEMNYTNQNRVNALAVTNSGTDPIYAEVELTDGRTFGQVVQPGPEVLITLPNNTVTMGFPNANEVTMSNVAYIRTRGA